METPKPLVAKKTFYYHFIPTKAEEEAAKARNVPYQVTRTLFEINDISPPQLLADPNYPWLIRKVVSNSEIMTGKLVLSHNDIFDHVFRYWALETCNHVVMGHKYLVILVDFTDEKSPKRYQSEHTFLERGVNETYILGWLDIVRNRLFNTGDEIGLFWDVRSGVFHFKMLRRGG
ncbi:hypothetical protein BT93_C0528 [Corymbia citriodora subsp. variegata]|nr:hypothetical protein BT93_C0528 [Corymbia citriodora subsp. variegata]